MRRTSSQMYPLLREYEESGLSKKEFCRTRGLSYAVFWYWYRKYKRNGGHGFIELSDFNGMEVNLEVDIGQVRLKFSGLPPVEYLRSLVHG